MSKIVGVDLGNSAVKIATENLHTIVPTMIAPGFDLRTFEYNKKNYNKDQLLDVFVESSIAKINGRYFVGKLAYNESKARLIERNPLSTKSEDNVLLIVLLTSLAYHLLTENPNSSVEYVKLYIGIPIEEFFNTSKNYVQIFKEKLKTTHTIKFLEKSFNGAEMKIVVEEAEFVPEGSGALFSFIKSEEELQKNRLLIDIGRYTTDVLYFENGNFQRNSFIGIGEGTATPIAEIQKYLLTKHNVNLSYFQIDNAIRNKNSKIKIYGELLDLSTIVDNAFKNFNMLIVNKIADRINQNALSLAEVDEVLLVGGGAILMRNYINLESIINRTNIIFSEDAIMANAIGNYRIGKAANRDLEDDEKDTANKNEIEKKNAEYIEIEEDII